jgi:hypothetical protein
MSDRTIAIELDERELAAVLAGLRSLSGTYHRSELEDILTDGGSFEQLDDDEIDELCERINFGE